MGSGLPPLSPSCLPSRQGGEDSGVLWDLLIQSILTVVVEKMAIRWGQNVGMASCATLVSVRPRCLASFTEPKEMLIEPVNPV